jgi:hypothetical protein
MTTGRLALGMALLGWGMACTGSIGGKAGRPPSGGAAGAGLSTGAAGGVGSAGVPPDTIITPPGTVPMPVDPMNTDMAKTCTPSIAPSPLRRLSYAEYQATTKDLLGVLKTADVPLMRDPALHGFENRANLLNPSPLLVEQYGDAAIDAGLKVSGALSTPGIVPCAPQTAAEEKTCGATFVEAFGARAFRRPLTAEEKVDFTTFFEGERAGSGFTGAVQLTIEAFLQSPQFLYRIELGDPATAAMDRIKLTPYEIASRLSFLVIGSAPDKTLFDAAAAAPGALDGADVREAQARRLLQDSRAGKMMVEFHRQWLDFDRLAREAKDATTYPQYTAALQSAIREESDRFVEKIMWKGPGTLAAFLTSTAAVVNKPLGDLYGVAAPATGWGDVTLDAAKRAGWLTRANFLASRAHQLEGSPPLRSVFIRERLFCIPPPTPPADANLSEPKATAGTMATTNRELFEARIAPAACNGCHSVIDTIGYGLENYDAIGGYRTMDNGFVVNAAGVIKGTDVDGPFTGGVELSQKLAGSKTVASCAAKTWFEYGIGRNVDTADQCRLAKLNLALSEAGGDVRELLVSLVKSPEFIYRTPIVP